jgi:hypothetical protein
MWKRGPQHRVHRGHGEIDGSARIWTIEIHFERNVCGVVDWRLLHPIVRGFARDDDVMDVTFAQASGGDADEAGFFGEFTQRGCADVAHAAFEAADELVGQGAERTFVRYAAFDAFGHGLAAFVSVLNGCVTVGAGVHRAHGTHAAVGLEGAALKKNSFAGRFLRAGEKATDHYAGSACGDGFGYVAGIFYAAVGNDGDAGALRGARGFHHCGELGNAGAGDNARGADRAGADADFQAVDAERDQIFRGFIGGDVSRDELRFGKASANGFDGVHHARRVAVCGVNREDVGFGFEHFDGALEIVARCADGGANAEPALFIFSGARVFPFFLDIFDGDEALEIEILVDDEKFFDAVLLQDALGFLERGADGYGDEIFLGHHGPDELGVIFFKAQVAVGEDSG